MSVEERDYKVEVLEYAINQCIDGLLPSSSENALSVILYQSNEVFWRVATEIYTKSGYQIDFVFIRDVLSLRVEPLQRKIAEEKRIRTELETQKLAKIAEEKRIKKEREAELERIRANQERIRKEKEAEEVRIRKKRKQEELQKFQENYSGIEINNYCKLILFKKIFPRIKKIIIEQLKVDEEQIKPDAIFNQDLGADETDSDNIDRQYIMLAIEVEFDIKIQKKECENLLSWNVAQLMNFVMQKLN